MDRNLGVGVLSAEEAVARGYTGPTLRASGVAHDIRLFEPYLVYDQVDFDIPMRSEGDSLARYYVRIEEMEQSVRIIRQCLDRLPAGPVRTDNAKAAYPSKDEVYYSMEGMIHDFMMTDTGVAPPKGAEVLLGHREPQGRARLLPRLGRHGLAVARQGQHGLVLEPPGPRDDDGGRDGGRHRRPHRLHRPRHRRVCRWEEEFSLVRHDARFRVRDGIRGEVDTARLGGSGGWSTTARRDRSSRR